MAQERAQQTTRARARRPPTFFWQGLLILLPVAVLSVVGFLALRQDRRLVEAQARQRARELADGLADKLWSELAGTNAAARRQLVSFTVDAAGRLVFPPPVAGAPEPQPFDLAALSADQARLWQTARHNSPDGQTSAATPDSWQQFLDLAPPERFRAVAAYSLALKRAQQGQLKPALELLEQLMRRFPAAAGDSGLPLGPLAQMKWLELAARQPNGPMPAAEVFDALGSNAVFQPTALTPLLLDRMAELEKPLGLPDRSRRWTDQARRLQEARDLFTAAQPLLPTNGATPHWFWFTNRQWTALSETPGDPAANKQPTVALASPAGEDLSLSTEELWLGVRHASGSNGVTVDCWFGGTGQDVPALSRAQADGQGPPRADSDAAGGKRPGTVGSVLDEIAGAALDLPEYLGLSIEVAGRPMLTGRSLSPGPPADPRRSVLSETNLVAPPILATASRKAAGVELLQVAVRLTTPDLLFQMQRTRARWFALLIAASFAAAVIGFGSAWRAFGRQQRLAEMKTNFVSSVSHELRAPIASVRLLAESLDRGKVAEPGKQREYFRFIVQECRRLSALIENVLDFARIEQGRKQYEFELTDLIALVRQTAKIMEPGATEKQIRLACAVPGEAVTAEVDARAVQQALVNLIDNALKHSPAASTVTIGLEFAPKGGAGFQPAGREASSLANSESEGAPGPPDSRAIHLWVEDHGPGIPPEEHEKIFERFYRLGSELRRETQGVGIGLSIVKHIVEAHGGRVTVRSDVGQGSRFTIELPLGQAAHCSTRVSRVGSGVLPEPEGRATKPNA